ncbi:MAG TPA: diaminopimelate epimerase [Dehalococcoidia bacterium]|nr:diaminopimelate epimerase [Dehalococcoidia bacterium]
MAEDLRFAKYQALGNDFIVIDARGEPGLVNDEALARGLLDRHFGVGADNLIFVTESNVADLGMRIRTPAGAWLTMCGNGIRCFARYVRDAGICAADPLRIQTDAGVRETRWIGGDDVLIEADLLEPDLRASAIPTTLAAPAERVLDVPLNFGALGTVRVSCVSVGNPHGVFFVDHLDSADMRLLGPAIERHAAFPEGVNVHAAQVLSADRARISTWERGAGLTLA